MSSPSSFTSKEYARHDEARLRHFKSLNIPIATKTLLEVGAGIGQHTQTLIDLGAKVTSSDARPESVAEIKKRFPGIQVINLDMDNPVLLKNVYDIIYCYGLLYHLSRPEFAIKFMSSLCRELMFIETCVYYSDEDVLLYADENKNNASQSVRGIGCRPSRLWVYNRLKKFFDYVYITTTQPNHEQFPIDWTSKDKMNNGLNRAVFIASRMPLTNPLLIEELPKRQRRFCG